MLKYGKRKTPLLPSFSTLRDSSATSRTKSNKTRVSVTGKPHISNPIPSCHDNSVDEIASMLLDDTTTLLDPTKRTAANYENPSTEKAFPQLPELLFNVDDAWVQRSRSIVTAAGNINEIQFLDASPAVDGITSSTFVLSADHSTPPIPRRSSRRNSAHPKLSVSVVEAQIKFPRPQQTATVASTCSSSGIVPNRYPHEAAMINAKIAAMQAATKVLKPDTSAEVLPGPLVPTKKRRILDNKVVLKMRTAINDRLSSRSVRKRHDSIRDDHLLDPSLNELNDDEELSHSVSNMDIRLNEGDNFNNPKVFNLTGHGNVQRKPVADDGRSIRSRKSVNTDPFSERPGSSGITRTPTNFELSLNDMPFDSKAEIIPDLPTSRPQSSRESIVRGKRLKGSPLSASFDTASFDALFSSSPLAQSTPRIRLEPTIEENGRRALKNVPADSRSLFDPETSSLMDVESLPTNPETGEALSGSMKRKNSQLKGSSLGFRYHSKRSKKHPSPSKAELEGMEMTLQEYPPFNTSATLIHPDLANDPQHENFMDVDDIFPSPILASKDPNAKVKAAAKPKEKRRGIGLFPKSRLPRTAATMPDISRKIKTSKSMIPKPADKITTRRRPENRHSFLDGCLSDSAMEIDEFQRNDSVFDVGVKIS